MDIIRSHKNLIIWAALVLVISLFTVQSIRLIDYPKNPEVFRDYLISRHITEFGERPLTGPYNSIFPALRNSPTYPYFWAPPSLVNTNPIFLTNVNVVLQVAGIIFLFLLGRRLFGSVAALFGTSIYVASWTWFSHTSEVWQPYTMQPFLLLGVWLYVRALQEKRYLLLLASFLILVFAGTFHYSVFALFPVLLLLSLFRIYTDYRTRLLLAGPPMTILISLFVFYLPVLVSIRRLGGVTPTFGAGNLLVDSFFDFLRNVRESVTMIVDAFFVNFGVSSKLRSLGLYISGIVGALLLITRARRTKVDSRFVSFILLLVTLFQPVLLSAIFNSLRWQYYFIPVFGLFALGLGYIVRSLFRDWWPFWITRVSIIGLLIVIVSGDFYTFALKSTRAQSAKTAYAIESSLLSTIEQIKAREGYTDYSFFQFWVYHKGNPFRSHDAEFWTMLERRLDQQFVKLVDVGNGYVSQNRSEYLFFTCVNFGPLEQTECLDFIRAQNPNYTIQKTVILQGQYAIYLATIQ